jgi:hypothetical protein
MNISDEELQHAIENNNSLENSVDAQAYQKVFDALTKEPYRLPIDFADDVVRKIETGKSSLSIDYFWLMVGLVSFIVATVITLGITEFKFSGSIVRFISGYSGLFFFGIVFILLIQYLDKRLLGHKVEM